MKSLAFPDMFTGSRTNTISDKQATMSNLKLIIGTAFNTLYGDPGYGNNLQETIFASNNLILRDVIKDEIYTCVKRYIPQVILNRDDIEIEQRFTEVYVKIRAFNKLTQTVDVYDMSLMSEGEDLNSIA